MSTMQFTQGTGPGAKPGAAAGTVPGPETQDILRRGGQALIGNYARLPVVMDRGEGVYVWDTDGKRYLDLFAGFGGSILGHCHPALVAAVREQAGRLWHVGNTFHTEPQVELAERLNRFAFPGRAFFCHSGAEANEAACKLARLRGGKHNPHRWKIVALHKSFHGRTLAMIAATGNPAVRAGFAPDVAGFVHVEPGNLDALEAAIDDETAGVLVEPIQGEGGVNLYPDGYLRAVRALCDERELTLIFDEVWTGCGRTGRWFGHQHYLENSSEGSGFRVQGSGEGSGGKQSENRSEKKPETVPGELNAGRPSPGPSSPEPRTLNPEPSLEPRTLNPEPSAVRPDVMTLGKAVGGGLPVGVMFARPEVAELMGPGKHGSTLGGNPICMAASRTIFDVVERERLVDNAAALGEHAIARLRHEAAIRQKVAGVRGRGLFLGIELKEPPAGLVEKALELGIVLNVTSQRVVRLAPPINITREQWDAGLDAVVRAIAAV